MTDLRKSRGGYKAALMKVCMEVEIRVEEGKKELLVGLRDKLKSQFRKFYDCHEEYDRTLQDEQQLEDNLDYLAKVKDSYIHHLRLINRAIEEKEQAPPDNNSDLSDIAQAIVKASSLPPMEIKSYDGNSDDFDTFMYSFKAVIESSIKDPETRLLRLKTYLTGTAYDAVQSCKPSDGQVAYDKALRTLDERFNDRHKRCKEIMHKLKNGKELNKPEELRTFADELSNAAVTLKKINMYSELDTQTTIVEICRRLPARWRYKWRDLVVKNKRTNLSYLTFADFVTFVMNEADVITDPVYGHNALFDKSYKHQRDQKRSVASHTNVTNVKKTNCSKPCHKCKQAHKLFYCDEFRSMPGKERVDFVAKNKLCENCLFDNHATSDCEKPYRCNVDNCKQKHCSLLHQTVPTASSNVVVNNNTMSDCANILMPIVPIVVNGVYATYALLDTGSTHSFCTMSVANILGIKSRHSKYELKTLNATHQTQNEVDLTIQPEDKSATYDLTDLVLVDNIPIVTSSEDLTKYPHLKGLKNPGNVQVDLLIGQNYADLLYVLESRKGSPGQPYATKTALGWAFNGPVSTGKTAKTVMSNFLTLSSIDEKVDRLYELDRQDLGNKMEFSREDHLVLDRWKAEEVMVNGHLQLPVPWINNDGAMPNNLPLAKSRLYSLQKSLQSKGIYDDYRKQLQKLVDEGYAEKLSDVKDSPSRCWYLPHHPVLKKNGDIRIVFDCASKYKGVSLNNSCMQGPSLTCQLFDVLLRFRTHQYAFMADIKSMFNQIRLPDKDRDALRFLWKEDDKLQVFRMTSFLFGGVFCPSGASYALKKTAEFTDDISIKNTIAYNFYVDNLAYSAPTVEMTSKVASKTQETVEKLGFHLTKYVASDFRVLKDIPQSEHLHEEHKPLPNDDKALGHGWNTNGDVFYVKSHLKPAETRSELLSSLASIFDPLGLVAPLTITGKIIFQESTRQKLDWNKPLPVLLKAKWNEWVSSMRNLESLTYPRCLIPSVFNDSPCELHCFSDASSQAYGTAIYVRCSNKFGQLHVRLVCSKARVCPIKSLTLPRMELQAAVLSTELLTAVKAALPIPTTRISFWTDSMIVLGYIKNNHRRFQVYVSNRIDKIRSVSEADQWFFIPGASNPADLLTRMKTLDQFSIEQWIKGPDFLHEHMSKWSITRQVIPCISEEDPEVKTEVTAAVAAIHDVHPIDKILDHFSSWIKVKRSVAWLIKIAKRYQNKKNLEPVLTAEEVRDAEEQIIRHVQQNIFHIELALLSSKQRLPRGHYMEKLDPCVNSRGILVVGGRLQHANLEEDQKHPPILPSKHIISKLICRSVHERCHLGREWVVSLVRRNYWIPKIREIVYKVCKDCNMCRILFAKCSTQKMANLPEERVQCDKLPFQHVSVDCFGPFYIRRGRSECKRYGCVFTCLNYRAVHLEKLVDLSGDSFISGLRRYIARRGKPAVLISDQATNFKYAKDELTKSMGHLDITWKLLPPTASHMNGAVERQIRTIRKVMTGMLTEKQRLTDDILNTLFCEVESIINSRPLTKVSTDPLDANALTPADLLLVRSSPPTPLGRFFLGDMYRRRWRYLQYLVDQFWRRYLKEYLPQLQQRHKWHKEQPSVKEGDLVLLLSENTPRYLWPKGVVESCNIGRDGKIRSVRVRTKNNLLVRPISKIVLLECH